jgi:hypothetical protein
MFQESFSKSSVSVYPSDVLEWFGNLIDDGVTPLGSGIISEICLQEDVAQWLDARIAQRGPAYNAAPHRNRRAAQEDAATEDRDRDRDQSPREAE